MNSVHSSRMRALRSTPFKYASALSIAIALTACGGGGGGDGPAPDPISLEFTTPPPTSMQIGAKASVAALVVNDLSGAGVTWSANCAASDCGSFSPTGTASGSLTTYTAPANMPSASTVTLVATSNADGAAKASSIVTITPVAAPALADGTYVYHLSGQDGQGPYTVSGAFTVAGGVITGGEQDFTDPSAGYVDSIAAATSSISVAGGNVQIVLDTGNTAIGVNGVETVRATPVSSVRLLASEFDLSAQGTGSIDLQTSQAAPSAGYAFSVSGTNTQGNAIAIGGVMNVVGNTVSPSGSVFDVSIGNPGTGTSTSLQRQTFQSGTVSAPDAYGRVVFTLTPSVSSGVPPLALAGYIVGANRIQLVESAETGDTLNANTGGTALGQGVNTGTFSAASASVAGQSYAHGSFGLDANGIAAMSGAFVLNSNGTLGGVLALNDLSYIGAWRLGGSYAVDSTGRVTVSVNSLTSQTAQPPASTLTFQLYLDGNGNAMVLGADAFQTTQGIAFTQGNTSLNGRYALTAQGVIPTTSGTANWSAVGPATIANGNFGGSIDFNNGADQPYAGIALGGYQDTSNGLLQLIGLAPYDTSATSAFGYYPLSGNRVWAIEVDHRSPALLLLEGVAP